MTVFLIDDDPSVRRALARLIKSAGYQVETFGSARDFLDREARGEGAACLVLDIRMPGLSGLDLQRELQAADATLPIIFITGHGDVPMSVQAMKAGAVEFLTKPFGDAVLLTAIRNALERSREALRSAAGFLRGKVARALSTRTVPELHFELDRGVEHAARIDALLAELKREPQA